MQSWLWLNGPKNILLLTSNRWPRLGIKAPLVILAVECMFLLFLMWVLWGGTLTYSLHIYVHTLTPTHAPSHLFEWFTSSVVRGLMTCGGPDVFCGSSRCIFTAFDMHTETHTDQLFTHARTHTHIPRCYQVFICIIYTSPCLQISFRSILWFSSDSVLLLWFPSLHDAWLVYS